MWGHWAFRLPMVMNHNLFSGSLVWLHYPKFRRSFLRRNLYLPHKKSVHSIGKNSTSFCRVRKVTHTTLSFCFYPTSINKRKMIPWNENSPENQQGKKECFSPNYFGSAAMEIQLSIMSHVTSNQHNIKETWQNHAKSIFSPSFRPPQKISMFCYIAKTQQGIHGTWQSSKAVVSHGTCMTSNLTDG